MAMTVLRTKTINKKENTGINPQREDITIASDCQFEVYLKDSNIKTILAAFGKLRPQFRTDFF